MIEILGIAQSVWWLLVTLGVLICFHEYGHYLVARWCGVQVLNFSLGFGKELWGWDGRGGTRFSIRAIPLGGFVKMLDSREGTVPLGSDQKEYRGKPIWKRAAILAAGPGFNFLLALALFWMMLVIGKPDFKPYVGHVQSGSLAAQAGFVRGDKILAINGAPVVSWSDLAMDLSAAAHSHQPTPLSVRRADGRDVVRQLRFNDLSNSISESKIAEKVGLMPQQLSLAPIIGTVSPTSPAARAGLLPGDRILAVGATGHQPVKVQYWDQVAALVASQHQLGNPLVIELARGQQLVKRSLSPEMLNEDGRLRPVLGLTVLVTTAKHDTVLRRNAIAAIPEAFRQAWDVSAATVKAVGMLFTGKEPLTDISGPISIAHYANTFAHDGAAWFLFFLGIVSINLGIMNLLPIPVLDGGGLLLCLIEALRGGRALSDRAERAGQYAGLVALGLLMSIGIGSDIMRLLGLE